MVFPRAIIPANLEEKGVRNHSFLSQRKNSIRVTNKDVLLSCKKNKEKKIKGKASSQFGRPRWRIALRERCRSRAENQKPEIPRKYQESREKEGRPRSHPIPGEEKRGAWAGEGSNARKASLKTGGEERRWVLKKGRKFENKGDSAPSTARSLRFQPKKTPRKRDHQDRGGGVEKEWRRHKGNGGFPWLNTPLRDRHFVQWGGCEGREVDHLKPPKRERGTLLRSPALFGRGGTAPGRTSTWSGVVSR